MREPARYSRDWWLLVAKAWNSSDQCDLLAGFGDVTFEVLDSDIPAVTLSWNKSGHALIVDGPGLETCKLSAPAPRWDDFVNGKFGAAVGVLTGKIRYSGSLARLLPFPRGFDRLAEVARRAAS